MEPTPNRVRALLDETSICQQRSLRKQLLDIASRINADNFTSELIDVFSQWRDGDLREAIRNALLQSSSAKVVDDLVNLGISMADDQRLTRDIGRTLSNIRNPQAVHRLLAGLNSPNISIAAGCAAALAAIGNGEAVQGLLSPYPGVDDERKMILSEAISRLRNTEAIPLLNEALLQSGFDPNLRESISRTLDIIRNR